MGVATALSRACRHKVAGHCDSVRKQKPHRMVRLESGDRGAGDSIGERINEYREWRRARDDIVQLRPGSHKVQCGSLSERQTHPSLYSWVRRQDDDHAALEPAYTQRLHQE